MSFRKKDEPVVKKLEPRFTTRDDGAVSLDDARARSGANGSLYAADGLAAGRPTPLVRKPIKISTVSHTLDAEVAERLRHFAFRERISESAVIEFSLRLLFGEGDDGELGQRLRDAGAALRRRT